MNTIATDAAAAAAMQYNYPAYDALGRHRHPFILSTSCSDLPAAFCTP